MISDVLVDDKSVGAVEKYTFEKVREKHTIEAVFALASGVADPEDTGVSDWLNTKDHTAYLSGYANGSFGPNKNMTRAEAAQMFYNLRSGQLHRRGRRRMVCQGCAYTGLSRHPPGGG